MMLDLVQLHRRYQMQITGVLHAGARLGEEADTYSRLGIRHVWWVEANKAVLPRLAEHVCGYGHKVIPALLYEKDGVTLDFHITNHDGMSSSYLKFGTHTTFSPDTKFIRTEKLVTSTIDTLVEEYEIAPCNFLLLDLQGAELAALRGASELIPKLDYIFTEVNRAEVYIGCAKVEEIDAFLPDFKRVETYWVDRQDWGDSLYVRASKLPAHTAARARRVERVQTVRVRRA